MRLPFRHSPARHTCYRMRPGSAMHAHLLGIIASRLSTRLWTACGGAPAAGLGDERLPQAVAIRHDPCRSYAPNMLQYVSTSRISPNRSRAVPAGSLSSASLALSTHVRLRRWACSMAPYFR